MFLGVNHALLVITVIKRLSVCKCVICGHVSIIIFRLSEWAQRVERIALKSNVYNSASDGECFLVSTPSLD